MPTTSIPDSFFARTRVFLLYVDRVIGDGAAIADLIATGVAPRDADAAVRSWHGTRILRDWGKDRPRYPRS